MSQNGKLPEPVIASPLLPQPTIKIEVPYFPGMVIAPQPVPAEPAQPSRGWSLFWAGVLISLVWYICWGWEVCK